MSTVLHFPDVSSFDKGIDFSSSYVVVAKATEGTDYVNPLYQAFRTEANQHDVYFVAYHFLHAGNGKAQADHYCSVVPAGVHGMVDIEPTGNSRPSIGDALDFIHECKAKGREIHLSYLPHWYWKQLGSPELVELRQADQMLYSSDYTTYSDNGPGWNGYGGMEVAIWQYADNVNFGGIANVDFNAFKGDGTATSFGQLMAQFDSVVRTGSF